MALIFSQGYMIGNGDPNLDIQIQDGGSKIPKLYIDDLTDSVYGFDGSQISGQRWYKYLAGTTSKSVDLKVWLRGPSLGATMSTTLATNSLLPLSEPYEGLGFTRSVFSGETVSDLTVFTANNITDWILVELRDKDNPEIIKYNRAALLKNNGIIVDVDGFSPLEFVDIEDFEYFISIRHRNHLGIMTLTPVNIENTVDFTLLATPYTGPSDYRILHTTNYSLRAGKVGNEKTILHTGNNSWSAKVLAALSYDPINILTSVYSVFDLNFDGNVIYSGGGADRTSLVASIGGSSQIRVPKIEFIPPYENKDVYTNALLYDIADNANQVFKTVNAVTGRSYEEKYYGKTSLIIPKGTTAERPSTSLESGMVRYNTTDNKLEYYNGTVWVQL